MKTIKSAQLGEKLKSARETRGLTQATVAKKLEVARTTLVAIEKGTRGVTSGELMSLAELYGRSVGSLLRDRDHVADSSVRFRKGMTGPDRTAVSRLAQLGESVREVRTLLGRHVDAARQRLPPARPIRSGRVRERAEDLAREARHWLGVSPSSPLGNLAELLEDRWGVHIFVRPVAGQVSGAYLYDPVIGACILLNAHHPPTRRLWSLAHETGHLLTVREESDVDRLTSDSEGTEETFVDAFAAELLLPASALREKFVDSLDEEGELSVYQLIYIARHFRVSLEALCRRMERLELAERGLYSWLKRGGISLQSIGPSSEPDASESPSRFVAQVLEALDRALVTEGQATSMLDVDRLQLRDWRADFSRVPLEGET